MWPFNRSKSPASPEIVTEAGTKLPLPDRVSALEARMDQLTIDWEDVLSKITRRFARDAARSKLDLSRMVQAGDEAESGAEGQPEAPANVPSKAELWRRSRAKGA